MAKSDQKGFSAIEVLIIVLVLAILAFGGWFVYNRNHTAKTTNGSNQAAKTETSSQPKATDKSAVATADGKVSVTLPNGWQVDSQYIHKQKPAISEGSKATCVNIDDKSPCLYEASFLPPSILDGTYGSLGSGSNVASNNSWSLTVEKTDWTLAEAISQIGGFADADLIAQNDNSINGYSAHFVKGYYGSPHTQQSGMAFYVIKHGDYLAVFQEGIQPITGHDNPITLDSSIDAEFSKLAQSLRFH